MLSLAETSTGATSKEKPKQSQMQRRLGDDVHRNDLSFSMTIDGLTSKADLIDLPQLHDVHSRQLQLKTLWLVTRA